MKLRLQHGIIVNEGIHWQYHTTITHGGCRNVVLDVNIGDGIKAIVNYGVV